MIDPDQIKSLSKSLKTSESVVIREYIQLVFLKELYDEKFSENIFFKGGTCIRLIFGGMRFSEDLDFTVLGKEKEFDKFFSIFSRKLEKLYQFSFKKRKTLTGRKYLLSASIFDYETFINLDFSFREKVLSPSRSVIVTEYPVIFTSFVNHLSAEEILAEKVRAVLTRSKGRDIYDLWFLLSKNTLLNKKFIEKKLKYYRIGGFNREELVKRIKSFSKEKFITDLRPFVPINEREKLDRFFDYTISFLAEKLGEVD